MRHFLQYFNHEKMGRFPNGADALLTTRMGVFTKLAAVKGAAGSTVFVICGLGKPKTYYLWEAFTIADVTHDGEQYTVSGPGWVLLPPQKLAGKAFDAFKAACAHFIGFRAIDDLPYCKTLRELADQFRGGAITPACEPFGEELVKLLPKDGDAYYYRATVKRALGKRDEAKADFRAAVERNTHFRHEAELGQRDEAPAPTAKPAATNDLAAQIVARGKHATGKGPAATGAKPYDLSEHTWGAIGHRRGRAELRQRLLAAYDGRCAVSGFDAEAGLEVAYLIGDGETGPHEPANAVLLRSDLHTLFDLNLLRIHPVTRKVFLAETLRKSRYAPLTARQLRLPTNEADRPARTALESRWKASGG